MVQLGGMMKFVHCVLLVGIANVVHCGNQSGEAQCSGFGYELLIHRFDLLQETISISINRLMDLVTENKKNTEQALNEIKADNSRLSSSLERLENLVYNNKNSTEESFAKLKASMFTNSSRLFDSLASYVNQSKQNTERKIEDLTLKMFTNNSKLVQQIADLETLATTMSQNLKTTKDITSEIAKNVTLVENNTRELLKKQARTTCLITDLSAATSRKLVYEMDKFDGGWIVIQQRIDHKLQFNRSWTEYRDGFGTVAKGSDFWLGLEPVHLITSSGNCELAVEIKDKSGKYQYARYSQFKLTGEDDKYRLQVGGYSGTAEDQITWHNNAKFSTYDSDNDSANGHCANYHESGWWYYNCSKSNLNFPRGGDGMEQLWKHISFPTPE